MKLGKRLLHSEAVRALLVGTAVGYIRLLRRTTRWRVDWAPASETIHREGRPFLGCFWHGRLMAMAAWHRRPEDYHVMISAHRDGLLISRIIGRIGSATVAGSSRRGGTEALRTTRRILDGGGRVLITPDGPRGPRMRCKLGLIKAAQLTGAPIIPVAPAVDRCRVLGSWDRFCLVLPFGRGVVLCGEPLSVPRDAAPAELERLNRELEDRLNALSAEADRLCGRAVIEPAARPTEAEGARA